MTASAAAAWCREAAESGWARGPVPGRELAPGQGQAPEQARERVQAQVRGLVQVPEQVPVPVPATARAPRPPGVVRSHLLLRRSPSARLLTTT